MSKAIPQPDHKWSADRPGERPEDDELGRGAFAERVAKELRAWRQKDSLVVSLNGDWGSGKTTLANYILYYIDERAESSEKTKPTVVKFNPWQWSGQDKLLEGFFDEVGAAFRSNKVGDTITAKNLARFWDGLKVMTIAGGELATGLREGLVAATALLAGSSGIVSSYITIPWLKALLQYGSFGLLGISAICAVYAPLAEKLAAVFEWKIKKSSPTLNEIRTNLRKELGKLKSPLIVVIDDIDRLTKNEMRLLVQLVKANADFPNLIYLLLYQRDILANALDEVVGERGGDFLKKIVQVELEMPIAPPYKMRQFFNSQVEPLLLRAEMKWDKERWGDLFNEGVWPYFKTPRDIKRFKGVLEFYFDSHTVEGVLEVNPIDLIVLETLRMFDPQAYEAVSHGFKQSRRLFMEDFTTVGKPKISLDFSIEGLLERKGLAEDEKQRLGNLLYSLFPKGDESTTHNEREEGVWERDLRICHPKHFRRYFELGGDENDITASFMSKLLKSDNDRENLRNQISEAFNAGKFAALIERLQVARKDIPVTLIEPLITALFDLSDNLPKVKEGLLSRSAEQQLAQFVELLLKKIDDKSERTAVLRRASLATVAVSGPFRCLYMLRPRKEEDARIMQQPLVDLDQLSAIELELLPRLWEVARTERFWELNSASLLIHRLRDLAGITEVQKWLLVELDKPKAALTFLHTMLNESHISGSRGTRTVYTLLAVHLEKFVDLEKLYESAGRAAKDDLGKAAVKQLHTAIRFKKDGKSYEEIYVLSQDEHGKYLYDESDTRL